MLVCWSAGRTSELTALLHDCTVGYHFPAVKKVLSLATSSHFKTVPFQTSSPRTHKRYLLTHILRYGLEQNEVADLNILIDICSDNKSVIMGSVIVNLATTCLAFVGLPSYLSHLQKRQL